MNFDNINKFLEESKEIIINTRKEDKYIYDIVLDYISKNEIFVGGSLGLTLITKRSEQIDDFVFEFYYNKILKHVNAITNLIAKKHPELNVIMGTKISYFQYSIFVNNNEMFKFYEISHSTNIPIHKLIKSYRLDWHGYKLEVLPPSMYLIDLYQQLYHDADEEILDLSKILYNKYMSEIKDKKDKNNEGNKQGGADYSDIKLYLLKNLDHIIIGEYATEIARIHENSNDKDNSNIRKYILETIYDEETFKTDELKNMIENFYKENGKIVSVSYKIQEFGIMSDSRLQRYAFTVDGKEILYSYNSSTYEIIPFNKIKFDDKIIKIGTIYVLLRFLFISVFIIRLLRKSDKIDKNFAEKRIKSIIDSIEYVKESHIKSPEESQKQSKNIEYIGVYYPYTLYIKVLRTKQKKMYYDYNPYIYKKANGEYREL